MTRIQRILVSLAIWSESGVLLLRRCHPYSEFFEHDRETQVGVGLWELPGGGSRFAETLRAAAIRETSEEVGFFGPEEDLKLAECCAYVLKGSECESHRIHIIYQVNVRAVLQAATLQIRCSKEHDTYQWVQDRDALHCLSMIAEVRNIIDAVFDRQHRAT